MPRWFLSALGATALVCAATPGLTVEMAKPAPAPPAAAASSALTSAEMADISGGTAIVVNTLTQQQLTATSSGNTVTAGTLSSGAVTFSPQALSGFSGVGNFVVNTGANNVLQGSIILSIVTAPPV